MHKRGKFIVVDGPDGVGKTTQVKLLVEALNKKGIKTIATREPGGTPIAEKIREFILNESDFDRDTELLLHFAARNEHVKKLIIPTLDEGTWVVSDRYYYSTHAYQVMGQSADEDLANRLIRKMLKPDFTVILQASFRTTKIRMLNRNVASKYERFSENALYRIIGFYNSIYFDKGNISGMKILTDDISESEVLAQIMTRLENVELV